MSVGKVPHQSRVCELDRRWCGRYPISPPARECLFGTTPFKLQSEIAEILSGTEGADTTSTTVAEFLDETPGTSWSIANLLESNLVDRQPEVELAKFLSRPVLIKTHTWAQTDSFATTTTWNPWYLFFNSTPIKSKLNNYAFIHCKLKLKFVINASPFYSGAMAFTYCPLQGLVGTTIITDAQQNELMGHSQRPKVWIFPQTNQGGEITLPFFYHKNWLNITSATDTQNMGTITPCLFSQLVSANGITGTSVLIHVYAWAEEVKLHAPTLGLAMQSDEFEYKPSQIASSVSAATGKLSKIPLIGPYMRATSVVASGFASVASALGFTNVPNVDTVNMVKLGPFPQNSSCEISVPIERSGVDPKNEVTLDPRTVGLDGTDELAISHIAKRECYLGSSILSSGDALDALLFASRVTPALVRQYSSTTPKQYTPCGYLCEMFQQWRGDLIFRFKFICTKFHKGRVRISFDPVSDICATVPDYTTIFNEIVDIGAEQDVEVRVPYMQATTYLNTVLSTGNYKTDGTGVTTSIHANGMLTVRVVNPLSGPIASTAIPMLIFVRGADNLEYAWPSLTTDSGTTLSPYTLQSDTVTYAEPRQIIAGNMTTDGDPNRHLVHHGESIKSLRPLLHRLAYQYTVKSYDTATTETAGIHFSKSSRRLKYPGYDTNGAWTASQTIGVGTAAYNFVYMNHHQLTSLLFIGQRGSINHSYNVESSMTEPPSNLSLKRFNRTITAAGYRGSAVTTATTNNTMASFYNTNYYESGNGVALTDQRCQPGIAMNFPYYSRYNFQFVNPANATLGSTADDTDVDNTVMQIVVQKPSAAYSMRYNVWSGYGPDYNFFFFINTPSLYAFTVPAGV